jgi:hypothetical protein
MQKVEGSSPFIRFTESPYRHNQTILESVAQSLGLR